MLVQGLDEVVCGVGLGYLTTVQLDIGNKTACQMTRWEVHLFRCSFNMGLQEARNRPNTRGQEEHAYGLAWHGRDLAIKCSNQRTKTLPSKYMTVNFEGPLCF